MLNKEAIVGIEVAFVGCVYYNNIIETHPNMSLKVGCSTTIYEYFVGL